RHRLTLQEAKDRLAADLKAMTHLQELGARAVQPGSEFPQLFGEVLDAAIAIAGADRGNLQLFEPETGTLKIVAQRGFDSSFVDFFQNAVDRAAACTAAMKARRRVIV